MVEHVGSLRSTSKLRFFAAIVCAGFQENTCVGKCPECGKQSTIIFQAHSDLVRGECSYLAPAPESAACQKIAFNMCREKRATSATTTPAVTNQNREILDELAERLGNFHDSARALAICLQTRDVARETDQSMIEAAKCMFHKLLGETSDDLERVTLQSSESLHIETTRYKRRCSRFETPSEKLRSCSETLVGNSILVPRQRLRIAPRRRVQNFVLVR